MALFWQAKDAVDAAEALCSQSKRDDASRAGRREVALKYGSLFEGLNLSSLGPYGYAYDGDSCGKFWGTDTPIIKNVAHEVVDTFVSKIGALDAPKPAMLTTEGSWKERRQAKDLERLVEAEFLTPKAGFATLNELWIHGLRIAAASTGAVVVRFYADGSNVNAKIHDSLDCTLSDNGTWAITRTWYEVDDAVDLWPDREDDIRAAKQAPPVEQRAPRAEGYTEPDMVCVLEGWRGANGDRPGTYVCALDNGHCEALVWEEYPHERPPLVKLVVDPHLYGPWGNSLTHHLYESTYRSNVLRQSIDRSISKTNKSTTYIDKSKLDDPNAMEQSDDNQIVYINKDGYVPTTVSPAGFNPQHLAVAMQHDQDAHQVTGVSEAQSGGRKEPGIDSAIGQRYVAALINDRFAAVQRRYVQAVAVDSAKVIIQVLCDIYQDNRKLTRMWPGRDSLREVSAAVALRGIAALKYVIQPAAVSGNKNSPADRAQTAFELFKSGILSQDAYAGLQSSGYDLPEELDDRDTQREWIDRQLDRYMFASDKDIQDPNFYVPPLRHMGMDRLLLRTIDGFLEAQMQGLEDERLEFFLMLLADCSALLPQSPPPGPMPDDLGVAA